MKRVYTWLLTWFFVFAVSTAYSDDADFALPDTITAVADRVVGMITESLPYDAQPPVVVAVRSVEMGGFIPPLGEMLAITISTRLANADVPGVRARALLPVDSYLSEFANLGSGSYVEEDFSIRSDYILVGEAFEAENELYLFFQIIEVESETIVTGLEAALALDEWLYDLLRLPEIGEDAVYVEADRFEPDSAEDPLFVSSGETVGERTIGPPGDQDCSADRA